MWSSRSSESAVCLCCSRLVTGVFLVASLSSALHSSPPIPLALYHKRGRHNGIQRWRSLSAQGRETLTAAEDDFLKRLDRQVVEQVNGSGGVSECATLSSSRRGAPQGEDTERPGECVGDERQP